jgi:two-component system sensor histidine kinase TctE
VTPRPADPAAPAPALQANDAAPAELAAPARMLSAEEEDEAYKNPFAPPDESAAAAQRPRSLFGEILDWMLAPLLLLWPMSIAVTYLVAKSIANGPFDRSLETDVYVLARQLAPTNGSITLSLPDSARDFLRADDTDTIYYQVTSARGKVVGGSADLPLPVEDDKPQPGVVEFRDETLHGTQIRVAYTYVQVAGLLEQNYALVQVAETLGKRSRLANDIIKGVILPQFVILPLAIVLVWFGLSRGLAPLHALQAHIRARRPDDLSPLEASQAPAEIAPLVASFNELLTRLEQNMASQKRFIADAAHQMKTPLAGLRMQAELASRQTVSAEVRRSLEQIAASSEQAARLVTQLLAMARAENRAFAQSFEPVELATLGRQVMQDWVLPALAKRMDLGFEAPEGHPAARLAGNPVMLREMLGNLLDNAIRYTPAGGRITLRVKAWADTVCVELEDTGPGIPPGERAHVLERFYRILGRAGEGSGLGLAIVREIVKMHHGELEILDHVYQPAPHPAGTLIRLTFPRLPGQDLP